MYIVLRIGKTGSAFDNSCQGGVFIKVDKESFITSDECFVGIPYFRSCGKIHPFSGEKINNIQIPFAKEIKSIIEYASIVYSEHTYLGWDVAITSSGPCFIEVNLGFEIGRHQYATGGLRDEFMYDPNNIGKQKSKWAEVGVYWKSLEEKKNSQKENNV